MHRPVLVTGADQHQGLAVIRGLGLAGIPVIAAGPGRWNPGFASRFAVAKARYTPPAEAPDRFVDEVLAIARRHQAGMIMPAVESTLVALDARRDEVDTICPLAAPSSATLNRVIDKSRTLELARSVRVPTPVTVVADDVAEALYAATQLTFPLALKPRGNGLHRATPHHLDFKVKYVRSLDELRRVLEHFRDAGTLPLIQEYVGGTGVCVSALFDDQRAIALLPYARVREVPLTGGVSVVRETLPLDERLRDYTVRLLAALHWRGIAMVEFKYDAPADRLVLMEINGRFQASTALSLDAGLNLPELAWRLHAGLPLPEQPPLWRVGVRERWLRGDTRALFAHLTGATAAQAAPPARAALPGRLRAVKEYLADFRPGVRYDEFKWYDPLPGLVEIANWFRPLLRPLLRRRFTRPIASATRSPAP